MIRPHHLAARILAADFPCLDHEVAAAVRSGADRMHVDVMEPDFAPELAVGPLVCAALRCVTRAPIEVHLMVRPIDGAVPALAKAGASVIAFHPEQSGNASRSVRLVKDSGCKVGIALNPTTPLSVLDPLLSDIDLVLMMWASPGADGPGAVPPAIPRLRALRERVSAAGRAVAISVEGWEEGQGVAARDILLAGADTLVVGSALCGAIDRPRATAAPGEGPPPFPPGRPGRGLPESRRWR